MAAPTAGEFGGLALSNSECMTVPVLNAQLEALKNKFIIYTCRQTAADGQPVNEWRNYIGELTYVEAANGQAAAYVVEQHARHNHICPELCIMQWPEAEPKKFTIPTAGWDYARVLCLTVYMSGAYKLLNAQLVESQKARLIAEARVADLKSLVEVRRRGGDDDEDDDDDDGSPSFHSLKNWENLSTDAEVDTWVNNFCRVIGNNRSLSTNASHAIELLALNMKSNLGVEGWKTSPNMRKVTSKLLADARLAVSSLSASGQALVRQNMIAPANDRLTKEIAKAVKLEEKPKMKAKSLSVCSFCKKSGHKVDNCWAKNPEKNGKGVAAKQV